MIASSSEHTGCIHYRMLDLKGVLEIILVQHTRFTEQETDPMRLMIWPKSQNPRLIGNAQEPAVGNSLFYKVCLFYHSRYLRISWLLLNCQVKKFTETQKVGVQYQCKTLIKTIKSLYLEFRSKIQD